MRIAGIAVIIIVSSPILLMYVFLQIALFSVLEFFYPDRY